LEAVGMGLVIFLAEVFLEAVAGLVAHQQLAVMLFLAVAAVAQHHQVMPRQGLAVLASLFLLGRFNDEL